MLSCLFRRRPNGAGIPAALYGAIVARAREPALFRDLQVPDTVDGRFEMVVAHCVLAIRRLREAGEPGRGLAQEVFDTFCTNMDQSLREMGVGDLAVPKRMKKIGEAFYGRLAAYDSALTAGDRGALAQALQRNVYDGAGDRLAIEGLAAYMMAASRQLAAGPDGDLLGGAFDVPDAAVFSGERSGT